MSENALVVVEEYPLTAKSGKKYREKVGENGDILREYESGTIYNDTEKKLESGPPDKRISTENTADYQELNRIKKVKAVASAIAGEHGSVELGLVDLAKKAVKRAEGNGHVANSAFESLMKHYAPAPGAAVAPIPPGGARLELGSEAVKAMLGALEAAIAAKQE